MLDEYVSVKAAHEKYGVVLKGTLENYDLEVDHPATQALRKAMGADQLVKEAAE